MSFTISHNSSTDTMYQKMKNAVLKAKGTFEGTTENGSFSIPIAIGKISGNYKLLENGIEVDITKKPFFLSTKKIKEELENYIKD